MTLVITLARLLANLSRQQAFLNKHIRPLVKEPILQEDGSISSEDSRKIFTYYGLAVPAILGEAHCMLHNRRMSLKERWCSTCQGAMTGLFDDFFDKDKLEEGAIRELLDDDKVSYKTAKETLFSAFFKKALQEAPDSLFVRSTLTDVYQAQILSRQQEQSTISQEDIRRITALKGGSSLLFYRSAFAPGPGKKEKELFYQLGALMQLSNDIFDTYKDREAGIATLSTTASHIGPLRAYFLSSYRDCRKLLSQSGFQPAGTTNFMYYLTLAIFSRVMVCLDQYQQLENASGGIFRVTQYQRKQLICDMDTWINKWRSVRYSNWMMSDNKLT